MKRLLALLLVLTTLAGCTVTQPTEPTVPTEAPTAAPTAPPPVSLYVPDSDVETATAGAVRMYHAGSQCDGMLLVGDRVVLYYLSEQMQLKAYEGENLTQSAVASSHIPFPANGNGIQVVGKEIFYYNPGSNTMVILNEQLHERNHWRLPDGIQGVPVINGAANTAYFSNAEGVRAMDLSTGIAHMLRQQENYTGVLMDSCFDGKYLMCGTNHSNGTSVEFISTETGLLSGKDVQIQWIDSFGSLYFLERLDGQDSDYLFGQSEGDILEILVPEDADAVYPALELGGVLTVTPGEVGCVLDLYALDSGLRTASVTLEHIDVLHNVVADPQGYVWFMDEGNLYRWEPSKSSVQDETVYTAVWQISADPNESALAQCKADAESLKEQYGILIRFGKEAAQAPWEKMTPESRVPAIESALQTMEEVFSIFPEGMLSEIATIYENDTITISIMADTGMEQGQQTWVDGNAYIALETGENLRAELLRTLYRVMDTYLMAHTVRLDDWDAAKPAEDRARYFMEALTPDNQEFFEGWYEQTKLITLCSAFRSAFGMWYHEAELPWEQYLDEPLY